MSDCACSADRATDKAVNDLFGSAKPLPDGIQGQLDEVLTVPGVVFAYYCETCENVVGGDDEHLKQMTTSGLISLKTGEKFAVIPHCQQCLK